MLVRPNIGGLPTRRWRDYTWDQRTRADQRRVWSRAEVEPEWIHELELRKLAVKDSCLDTPSRRRRIALARAFERVCHRVDHHGATVLWLAGELQEETFNG